MLLKSMVPVAAAVVLDYYCNLRAKRRQKKEKATELTRWEGEGGAVVSAPRPGS